MRIVDLLDERSICLDAKVSSKNETLDKAVELMNKSGKISDIEVYKKGVYAREEESTTGIGEGIAIPHCKSQSVKKAGLAAMVIKDGVDFDSLDGEPVNLLFLIAAPDTKDNIHLDVLSKLSMLLMDEEFTANLKAAKSTKEFLKIIDDAESDKDEADEAKADVSAQQGDKLVLAVTGCPTGIAHTYMAAEAIEKAAAKAGHKVKVETRGSGGAKNVLTAEEIEKADGIIVAADTQVPMARFNGKKVIIVKVADGISKADELVAKAAAGDAPVFSGADSEKKEEASKGNAGHSAYKHLMNGVSHMLPFVIGGGILVALAFLIDTICGYGSTGGGNFGSCTPLSAFFKYVGGLAMGLMVPVLAGYIAESIADRPGLAVGFAGGIIAASGNAVAAAAAGNGYLHWFTDGSLNFQGFQGIVAKYGFMNGGATVSGFLGGIVAGFLAGYLVLGLRKLCDKLPAALEGIKPTLIYPVVGILVVGILMIFVFNPLIGVINTGLASMLSSLASKNLLVVLGLILGAMMAIDMGGPINKAAYVYGTMMLSTAAELTTNGAALTDPAVQACYISMAAVMAGGMVPPVGIALACLLFPKKFTKAERNSTVSNFVMGCGFITEGAIPFAAADPGHVIPATMAGAGVAGALTAVFKCTLMAPHGGVFVFATVGNPWLYILAWLIGSAVTCVLLGLLKKNVTE